MHAAALALVCLASIGSAEKQHMSGNPAAAFMPSGAGARFHEVNGRKQKPTNILMATKPFDVKDLAGITEPLGFFDPVGFSKDVSEGRMRFYREVELKHGRVGMLAALGFLVGEQFHPLFGGEVDAPSYLAFQQSPLEQFFPLLVFAISVNEVYSVFTFNSPAGGEPWSVRSDHEPGNLLFDPFKLRPEDPKEWLDMQNKELNNGRLAMLAAAGMIVQELVTGQKLF